MLAVIVRVPEFSIPPPSPPGPTTSVPVSLWLTVLSVIVRVPKFSIPPPDSAALPHGAKIWGKTMLLLPEEFGDRMWRSLFTGETLTPVSHEGHPALAAEQVFGRFPVALLLDHEETLDGVTEPHNVKA